LKGKKQARFDKRSAHKPLGISKVFNKELGETSSGTPIREVKQYGKGRQIGGYDPDTKWTGEQARVKGA